MLSPHPRHLQTSSPVHRNKVTHSNCFTSEKRRNAASLVKNNQNYLTDKEAFTHGKLSQYQAACNPRVGFPAPTLTTSLWFFFSRHNIIICSFTFCRRNQHSCPQKTAPLQLRWSSEQISGRRIDLEHQFPPRTVPGREATLLFPPCL